MSTIRQSEPDPVRSPSIASFFSALQLQRLVRRKDAPASPTAEAHTGAFLFLDVVAFTRLGEELSEQGHKGAEVLSDVLHAYYEPMLRQIREHGGDVLFFAGDALGVVWLAEDMDVPTAAAHAAQCALAIQNAAPRITSQWHEKLAFRASIGVGRINAYEVGGVAQSWMQLVRGEAIDRAYRADSISLGGTVAMSDDCLRMLERFRPKTAPLPDGFHRLLALDAPDRLAPLAAPRLIPAQEKVLGASLTEVAHRHLYYPSSAITAEFRRTTVLFVDLSGIDADSLQAAVEAAQQDVAHFEGVVYLLMEDDKGTSLIIVFGLPGTSHADDPLRAVLLSQRLSASYGVLGFAHRIGIATGTSFCGTLGTPERQQYSIIGSSVNLAARLMVLARPEATLCDGQTRKLAASDLVFKEAGWTTPKGFREPVPIFNPGVRAQRGDSIAPDTELVGRQEELDQIGALVEGVRADAPSKLLIIKADAGLGKTAFLQSARGIVEAKGLLPVAGATDAFETGTAYFAFRNIARHWCGVDAQDDADRASEKLNDALADMPELQSFIPLLGPVIGLDIPETELTATLRGQLRSENTYRVLLHLANRSVQKAPAVLLMEDGHWMDGASWAFLGHLLEGVPGLLVLLTTRPLTEASSSASALIKDPRTQVLDLQPITRADSKKMVQRLLEVSNIADEALDLIHNRAEGNALFVREILRNLLETGDIRVRKGRVELSKRQDGAGRLPDTLDGVITSRIDRLETDAQITIKAAAVLGRSFDAELLQVIHPLSVEQAALVQQLDTLQASGFLVHAKDKGSYAFDHALTRDAAYNLLSFAHREALHKQTALALEAKFAGNTDRVNARLGYHFRMANIPEKAAPHLAAAGETALDAYASRDAIDLLTSALELDEAFRGDQVGEDLNRTHWSRMIGQAYYNQDDQPEAANWYRRAITHAGIVPRYPVASIVPTLSRALFTPSQLDCPPAPHLTADDRLRMTHGLGAARELGIIYLWESAMGKFALNAVNQVRVARIVGPTDETANAVATLAFMMSSAGMRKKSEQLGLQSLRMANEFGDMAQIVAVQVITGMVLIQNGSARRALVPFLEAKEAAGALISGIWRHRSTYMYADAMTWLGEYESAHLDFLKAAELSHSAEPHAVGQATAMAALNLIRLGKPEQAVALLEGPDGVPNALEGGVPASAIMSLGVLAEARLALGQTDAALAAAAEAESHVTEKDDGTGFYSGLFGYSSILNVRLHTGTLGQASEKGATSAAQEDLKRMRKLVRVAPLGQATYALWQGLFEAQRGKTAKAIRVLSDATKAARAAEHPFELGRSLVERAKLTDGPARTAFLDEAISVFERHHMPLELARARALRRD